jgi:hypothetical protein
VKFLLLLIISFGKRNKLYDKNVKPKVSNYFTDDIFLFKQNGVPYLSYSIDGKNILK